MELIFGEDILIPAQLIGLLVSMIAMISTSLLTQEKYPVKFHLNH